MFLIGINRMELYCVEEALMITPRQHVFFSLMVNGLFVIIFSIEDIITPPGSDLMEHWCSLVVLVVQLQLRYLTMMEDHQEALIWRIRTSMIKHYTFMTLNTSFSKSCLIDEGDTFLLTGGDTSRNTVSRYNSDGWIEDIGSLNTGRFGHGCTHYTNNFGAEVTYFYSAI